MSRKPWKRSKKTINIDLFIVWFLFFSLYNYNMQNDSPALSCSFYSLLLVLKPTFKIKKKKKIWLKWPLLTFLPEHSKQTAYVKKKFSLNHLGIVGLSWKNLSFAKGEQQQRTTAVIKVLKQLAFLYTSQKWLFFHLGKLPRPLAHSVDAPGSHL